MLLRNPCASSNEVAKELGVARATIKTRIDTLLKEKWMRVELQINSEHFQLRQGFLFLTLVDPMDISKVVQRLVNCPRVTEIVTHAGAYHLIAHIIAENIQSLYSTMECIQHQLLVRSSTFANLSSINYPISRFVSLRRFPVSDVAPCGLDCKICDRFIRGDCLGCPATTTFKGTPSVITLGLSDSPK